MGFSQNPSTNAIALPAPNNLNAFNQQTGNTTGFGGNQQSQGGLFGNNKPNAFGSSMGGGLGQIQTNTLGNNNMMNKNTTFGQNTGTGLFGNNNTNTPSFGIGQQKTSTPSFGLSGGFNTPKNNNSWNNNNTGMFGVNSNPMGNNLGFGKTNQIGGQNNLGIGQSGNTGFGNNVFGNNNTQGQTTTTGFGNTGFGNNNSNNIFGNQNKPVTGMQTNAFGQNTNTGFGLNNMNKQGMGGANFNQNSFGNTNNNQFNQNSNTISFGGNNMGMSSNNPKGTFQSHFQTSRNAKNGIVNNINYQNDFKNNPPNMTRVTDYNAMKNGQITNPQISNNFQGYLNKNGSNNMSNMNNNMSNLGGLGGQNNTMNLNANTTFGQNNNNAFQFGNNNMNKTGGMFQGTNNNNLNKPPSLLTSNVIGGQQTTLNFNQPNNAFNKPNVPSFNTNTGGGLFGNNTNTQTNTLNQGGLFGNKPTNNQNPGNNILGGLNSTTNTLGGGLLNNTFNAKPNNTQGGGLFNLNPVNTNNTNTLGGGGGGGLFGTNNNNTLNFNKPAQNSMFKPNTQSNNLLGGNTGTGLNLFGNNQTQTNTGNMFAQQTNNQNNPFQIGQAPGQANNTQNNALPSSTNANIINLPDLSKLKTPYAFVVCPLDNNGKTFGNIKLPGTTEDDDLNVNFQTNHLEMDFNRLQVRKERQNLIQRKWQSNLYDYPIIHSVESSQKLNALNRNKKNALLNIEKFIDQKKSQNPQLKLKTKRTRLNGLTGRIETKIVESEDEKEEDNLILLELFLCHKDNRHETVCGYFKKDDLVARVLKFLVTNGNLEKEDLDNYIVKKQEEVLNNIFGLDEYDITQGERLEIVLKQDEQKDEVKAKKNSHYPSKSKKFQTIPNYEQILTMTDDELRSVPDFVVENEYGRIQFIEPVDLSEVDLDETIIMQNKMVEVYPIEAFDDGKKPELGEKLNQPAYITFKNFDLSKAKNSKFISKLKQMAESMNASIVEMDVKGRKLKIAVPQF